MALTRRRNAILGGHPQPPHVLGELLSATDRVTQSGVPHRQLVETAGRRAAAVAGIREMLERHHASPEALERSRELREAIIRLGLATEQARLGRFPRSDNTRKGNFAEVVLAEYIVASCGSDLPVYRLRYNPNVEQSMKGDDVLAFDLDADPVRVIVGESKFRGAPSATVVAEIAEGLLRSQEQGVPASLAFVADRLYDEGQPDLGARVMECAKLFAQDRLQLDYVGMLLSDTRTASKVDDSTPGSVRRLAMISLGVDGPADLVAACYEGLD